MTSTFRKVSVQAEVQGKCKTRSTGDAYLPKAGEGLGSRGGRVGCERPVSEVKDAQTQGRLSAKNQVLGDGSGAQSRKGADRTGLWIVPLSPSPNPSDFQPSP